MEIIIIIAQLILFIVIAPLLSGLVSKLKNNIRMRKGQSIFQPYYNLIKLFSKEEVVSETASWIFKAAPFVVFSAMLTAATLIPVFIASPLHRMGDFLALIFIFALGRFFMALAALDTGSSFGGMGASREMFISSLVEPAFCLVVFSIFLQFGSTDISVFGAAHPVSVCSIVAAFALFMITLAETSRIPVDNQETHLELTMVHEAMALEYSGRSLALIELSAHIKQMILFFLIAQLVFPVNFCGFWILWYSARIMVIVIAVALVEVSVAKMRLFRVADFLGFAFVLAMIAVVCAVLGV
ncbi:MAG: NADH-quinone oxidoreductase subunit H [Candidatus Omnitrophica bacterium]|nr:NADH-quinone oxidoreductase subunit H [Candidatus Omnitrophota bacterium]